MTCKTCVSFDRSLRLIHMDNMKGAYGYLVPGSTCSHRWSIYQREGWIQSLINAESEIRRDLGKPLCAMEICDELHYVEDQIPLNQKPIAYLGSKTYTDWAEIELTAVSPTDDDSDWYVDICDTELAAAGITDISTIEWSYNDDTLSCFTGNQCLQEPCVSRVTVTCGGGADDGYRFTWPVYQLVGPENDEMQPSDEGKLIEKVKWHAWTINASDIYEAVEPCHCSSCSGSLPTYTVTLCDATEGIVCIDGGGCVAGSTWRSRIRINYATAYGCDANDEMEPSIEEAVALLALVKAANTAAKPCVCDNTNIDNLLETDPTATTEFAHKLRYGPTVAGMRVWRILNKLKEKPHFNNPGVMSGGLLTVNDRKRSRGPRSLDRYW